MTKKQRLAFFLFPSTLMIAWWIYLPLLHAKEHKVTHGKVQFFVGKDFSLKPVLPVEIVVKQEEGGILDADQVLSCDVVARVTEATRDNVPTAVTETVFKCGERKFVIERIMFAESQ